MHLSNFETLAMSVAAAYVVGCISGWALPRFTYRPPVEDEPEER